MRREGRQLRAYKSDREKTMHERGKATVPVKGSQVDPAKSINGVLAGNSPFCREKTAAQETDSYGLERLGKGQDEKKPLKRLSLQKGDATLRVYGEKLRIFLAERTFSRANRGRAKVDRVGQKGR
jgi:hypothetical protein